MKRNVVEKRTTELVDDSKEGRRRMRREIGVKSNKNKSEDGDGKRGREKVKTKKKS